MSPAASDASSSPTPASFTSCSGSLSPDSGARKAKEPNLLDYSFSCNSGITAYTIIVNQQRDPGGAIDGFNNSPMVYETDGRTPSPTETVSCSGGIPSNGINCNTGQYLAEVSGGFFVSGSIDPVQSYCKHLPRTAKGNMARPGTPAIPTARVQLIVTDWTGAENGPFTLKPKKACPTVPNKVPPPVITTKTKTSRKTTSRKSRTTRTTTTRHATR